MSNHIARAVEAALAFTESGKAQVAVQFKIVEDGPMNGKRFTWFGHFTEATTERTIQSLRHCGCTFPGDNIHDFTGVDSNEVELVVEDEEYQGKIKKKVQWVNQLGGVALKKPMTHDQAKAFSAKMKGFLVSSKGAVRPASPPPRKPATPPPSREPGDDTEEDEIPF